MRYLLPLALLAAVVVGYHSYYWLADAGWPLPIADVAASGVERFLLYAVIVCLMLWPTRSVAVRAMAFVVALYGASEATQVAVCQSAHAITGAKLRLGGDACDALTGIPVGAIHASVWLLGVSVLAGTALARFRELRAIYSPTGVYTGFAKAGAGPWKVLAAIFAYPYCGKVWFRNGVGYRFDRACGALINDRSLRPGDYMLRPYRGDPALLRVGLPWSLRHNCVTLG